MRFYSIILFSVLVLNCKNGTETKKEINDKIKFNLVEEFKGELEKLHKDEIKSLDRATILFKDYANKTENFDQRDSLFLPYFEFYNLGRTLLASEDSTTLKAYGFVRKNEKGTQILVPVRSKYLKENILSYLSNTMEIFCVQQLKEFEEIESISTIAQNTIWWEDFNTTYPNFFLKQMTDYHYKEWHLKNLMNGTENVTLYNDAGYLKPGVRKIYEDMVTSRPNSQTGQAISKYLEILRTNGFKKNKDIIEFLEE